MACDRRDPLAHFSTPTATASLLSSLDNFCVPAPKHTIPSTPLSHTKAQWLRIGAHRVPFLLLAAIWPLLLPLYHALYQGYPNLAACLAALTLWAWLRWCAFSLSSYPRAWFSLSWAPAKLKPGLYCHEGPQAQAIRAGCHTLWETCASYSPAPYLFSGDWTTTFPFLAFDPDTIEYTRKWVRNDHDGEICALDLSFPREGFDPSAPVLFLLHGLNGGSNEGYVTSCASAAQQRGWTVVVHIARGLMGTPLSSESGTGFHGARIIDVHAALSALRNALPCQTKILGAGWSQGSIVLSQYVCATKNELGCDPIRLEAAVCLSGTFDCLENSKFRRSKELWQPILTYELKNSFAAQWQSRVEACPGTNMAALHSCVDMIEWDERVQVPLNGYGSIDEYYLAMSPARSEARLAAIQCPTLSLNALDDPIVHADTMETTVEACAKNPNLFVCLTQYGGHCGWPIGFWPSTMAQHKWNFMSRAVLEFCDSVLGNAEKTC